MAPPIISHPYIFFLELRNGALLWFCSCSVFLKFQNCTLPIISHPFTFLEMAKWCTPLFSHNCYSWLILIFYIVMKPGTAILVAKRTGIISPTAFLGISVSNIINHNFHPNHLELVNSNVLVCLFTSFSTLSSFSNQCTMWL